MNYELAKELKEAGFRFNWDKFDELGVLPGNHPFPSVPTLSELIEACGDDFASLEKSSQGGWYACVEMWVTAADKKIYAGVGITPEEAVARLWLALNKK